MTDRLRILQVVTLLSPDAAYGGPERVAFNQCAALNRLGHDTTVAAGVRGYDEHHPLPAERDGVRIVGFRAVTAVPGISFAGLSAPGMLPWLARLRRDFDLVHIHLARDLVTLPIGLAAVATGLPVVVQTHGMIDPTDKLAAKPLDLAMTRPLLRRADRVLYLNDAERADLETVAGPDLPYALVTNGVTPQPELEHRSAPDVPEVVMLARMHARKRPATFVEAAIRLLRAGVKARFTLIGPDEGEMADVERLIDSSGYRDDITWLGPIEQTATTARLAEAQIFVLPSIDEPFGMSVLEAMSVGLPVVAVDDIGLAATITDYHCGLLVDRSVEALAGAIGTLIDDPELRDRMGAAGRRAVAETTDIDAVAVRLVEVYRSAMARSAGEGR